MRVPKQGYAFKLELTARLLSFVVVCFKQDKRFQTGVKFSSCNSSVVTVSNLGFKSDLGFLN